jgi:hypothetical protein
VCCNKQSRSIAQSLSIVVPFVCLLLPSASFLLQKNDTIMKRNAWRQSDNSKKN